MCVVPVRLQTNEAYSNLDLMNDENRLSFVYRSLNAFCKVSTVAVRSVTNSVHFENRSTLVVVQQCLRTQ